MQDRGARTGLRQDRMYALGRTACVPERTHGEHN